MTTLLLSIHNLSSGFGGSHSTPLSIDLAVGDHLALSGPSGCGKSSLLRVIAGLMPAHGGEFHWQQQRITESNLIWWRKQCCYLPQEPVLGADTVAGVLRLPWTLKAESSPIPDNELCNAALVQAGLSKDLDNEVKQFSGGEKQRLAIARALLLKRPIWLLDEPTSALDPASRDSLIASLSHTSITRISISHDPIWLQSADTVFDMGNGHE
ncbi:ATP-binding cassette domain-containing protein [Enterovibrio sp. 27052020O]|uniref:ABC transporter ATP-binding protein n=1 Tax=Enterovibrio sp. 27052020O TaxID=3241166 RepID=UPI00388DAFB3